MSEIGTFGRNETVIFTFWHFLTLFGQVEIQILDLEMEDLEMEDFRFVYNRCREGGLRVCDESNLKNWWGLSGEGLNKFGGHLRIGDPSWG